jgi:hypothetical protein
MWIKSRILYPLIIGCSVTLFNGLMPDGSLAKPKFKENNNYQYNSKSYNSKGYKGHETGSSRNAGDYNSHASYQSWLNLPPGHLPPPGYCRYWYPGRPPGQQPQFFRCGDASYSRYNAPYGAYLVYTPVSEPRCVKVVTYDQSSDARVGRAVIQVFEALTGKLIRVIGA